jgi:cell division transport system ATP-binding protein
LPEIELSLTLTSVIRIVDLSKNYDNQHKVLDQVNLEIKEGEFVVFIGESGAGKTTLIKMITGEERPTSGDVFIDDIHVNRLKPTVLPFLRRKIGVIFQDYKLLATRTVYENVALALEVNGKSKKDIARRVPALLDQVGILDKASSYPRELSGGQKQRVAIARALSHDPLLLIADEPTGNLDLRNTLDIINLLVAINNSGTTVLLTTHDQMVVERLRKRIIELSDGKIVYDHTPEFANIRA